MDPITLLTALPSIISGAKQLFKKETWTGKKSTPDGFNPPVLLAKGLNQSKTATVAHAGLMGKIVACVFAAQVLPSDMQWLMWVGIGASVLEWGVQLAIRVKTGEPIHGVK